MKLNTKMRYGTRAMLALALHGREGAVSLSAIAASQEVSEKYLELLFAALRSAGIVRSQRGAKGGYVLARPPEQLTLREIFDALEGPEPYVPCIGAPGACHRWEDCVTQEVWARMYQASMGVLAGVTLADLVERTKERSAGVGSYSI